MYTVHLSHCGDHVRAFGFTFGHNVAISSLPCAWKITNVETWHCHVSFFSYKFAVLPPILWIVLDIFSDCLQRIPTANNSTVEPSLPSERQFLRSAPTRNRGLERSNHRSERTGFRMD